MDRFSCVFASCLRLFTATALVLAGPIFSQAPQTQSPDLSIQYTGKLFGYYRIEPGEPAKLEPVLDFQNANRIQAPGERSVPLLGMGDNFAPEFGASIQQEFLHIGESDSANRQENWSPCMAPTEGPPHDHEHAAPEALYKSLEADAGAG